MKNNKTKGRILDKSIEMFNARQASNVSTVQISKDMGISPGNLYYYYSNKEEIIRKVWEERICAEILSLADAADETDSEEKLRDYCEKYAEHYARYRFFYLEMPTLFANDRELKKAYLETVEKETDAAVKILNNLAEAGVIGEIDSMYKKFTGMNLITVMRNSWIDAFCLGERSGSGSDEAAWHTEYIWGRMKAFIEPYMRDKVDEEEIQQQ